MAQPHSQAQQRPAFPQQSQSFTQGFQPPNARSQFSPQSPAPSMSYSSPSPQPQFSPTYSAQAPPAKRPRLSPDAPSPYSQPVGTPTPQAGSPVNGQMNGISTQALSRPSLMPPPQQPYVKREEKDGEMNVFQDDGMMSFDSANTALPNFSPSPNTPNPLSQGQGSFDMNDSSSGQPPTTLPVTNPSMPTISQEEQTARDQERQDWEEARHSQHELWNAFLYGGTLNDKIKSISHRSNLVEPQSGVLVNTQKNQPPPIVRVNGHEGATRVIRDGQSILDTREKAERLNELVKLLSLSAKARLTGLIQIAARMATERRQHSQGRIPDEWADLAVMAKSTADGGVSSPTTSVGMKRTYSQALSESGSQPSTKPPPHPAVSEFEKFSNREIKAEQARLAKRRKRTEATTAQENEAAAAAEQDAIAAAAAENEKKTSKKERKMAESRISEQQQHASTNEAARMATANLFGRFANAKKKNYSWMTGGGGGGGGGGLSRSTSAAATPTRSTSVAAPAKEKVAEAAKGPRVGRFDEGSEPGIQVRDLLLVLESDGRAARSFVKASSGVDDANPV